MKPNTSRRPPKPLPRPDPVPGRRFKLVIAYDGSGFAGWQRQKIGTGVQEIVEVALEKLFPSRPILHSSSRTDTGVHARGMVAHFTVPPAEARLTGRKLLLAINAHLPETIRVMAAARTTDTFHARFDATGKQYRYHVWNHPALDPLRRTTAWHVTRTLDLAAMRTAAQHFVGRHDFRSFTANPGYARDSTVRHLTRCDIVRSGPEFRFIIEGEGFLYKMCRGIVGTLVQVGLGRFPPDEVRTMLAQLDRRVAGMTAPALGLVLWQVYYPKKSAPAKPTANPADPDDE